MEFKYESVIRNTVKGIATEVRRSIANVCPKYMRQTKVFCLSVKGCVPVIKETKPGLSKVETQIRDPVSKTKTAKDSIFSLFPFVQNKQCMRWKMTCLSQPCF